MELTMHTTGKAEYRDKVKILVTGPNGSCKTRFAATAPNVLFAEMQAGLMSIADKALPFVRITTEDDLVGLKNLLNVSDAERTETFGRPIDTLVVDTGDEFSRLLLAERMMTERRGEANWSDYAFVGQRLHTVVENLTKLPLHVVILVHYREMGKDEEQRILKPGFAGQFGDQCGQYFDYSVSIVNRHWVESEDGDNGPLVPGQANYLRTAPTATMDFLFDKSGRLPIEFPLNFEDDFQRIIDLVKRDDLPESTERVLVVPEERKVNRPASPILTAPIASEHPPVVEPEVTVPEAEPVPAPEDDPEYVKAYSDALQATDDMPVISPVEESAPTVPVEAPQVESATPTTDTPCENCSQLIETDGQKMMAQLRFRKPLCSSCFDEERAKSDALAAQANNTTESN